MMPVPSTALEALALSDGTTTAPSLRRSATFLSRLGTRHHKGESTDEKSR
jgi:hypothetical protein